MLKRTCFRCREEKELSEYYADFRNREGVRGVCKTCCKSRSYAWRSRNHEKFLQIRKRNNDKNKGYRRWWHLNKAHGISREQFMSMLINQDFECKICFRELPLVFDHDHRTGKIRGLICSLCNTGIGALQDAPMILSNALHYLGAS